MSLQTKWALLEPSCILSGCISPHSFGIVRGEPNKYQVGWCPANYDGCFCHGEPSMVLGLFVEPYSLAKLSAKTQDGDRAISSLSETAARATKYKKDLGFSSHGELDTEHFALFAYC